MVVRARDQRRRRTAQMALLLEEGEEALTQLGGRLHAWILGTVDLVARVGALLESHPDVRRVRLAGSRARGEAHELSDWDFDVDTDDFESVARDLPVLVAPLAPVSAQWDR